MNELWAVFFRSACLRVRAVVLVRVLAVVVRSFIMPCLLQLQRAVNQPSEERP